MDTKDKKGTESPVHSDPVISQGRLLSQDEVLAMWPVCRRYLSSITNHKNEAMRLPCIKLGRRKFYAPEELMWYREKNRYVPSKKKTPK